MPISPEDVVKVITDERCKAFYQLEHNRSVLYMCRIDNGSMKFTIEKPDPLSALAWAKSMFDTWDAKGDGNA